MDVIFSAATRKRHELISELVGHWAQTLVVTSPVSLTGAPVDGSVGSTYSWTFGRDG